VSNPTCKGKTKKGTRCKAHPLKGTDHCLAHSDADTRASVGFTPEAGHLGGRPPLPRPTETARRLIEANQAAVLRPHFRVLGYDVVETPDGLELAALDGGGAKVYGTEQRTGRVVVSEYDDLGAHVTASEKLQDRVYGRPKQATEITGPEGGPVQFETDLSKLSADELRAFRTLLAKAAATPPPQGDAA
jgi:hypothetical protein